MSSPKKPLATALVVAPPGPGRDSVVAVLTALGIRVRTAGEPYEGTARFVEFPTDLVVLSLAAFRRKDTAFLRTVRRRAPTTRVLLLVPEGAREMARRALEAGADVWLPEPWHTEELTSFVRCLLPVPTDLSDLSPESMEAIRRLSAEVSHAVNNPLQVVRLLVEQNLKGKDLANALEHATRIGDVARIVKGFGELKTPSLRETHLGTLVRESVEDARSRGVVAVSSPLPRDGVLMPLDPHQVRYAVDVLVAFLVAVGGEPPLSLKVGVHRVGKRRPPPARADRPGPFVEAAFKARGLTLAGDAIDSYRAHVICSHDESRDPHPGLGARGAGRPEARRHPRDPLQ